MHKTNAEMRACPKCAIGKLEFTKDMGLIRCNNCDYNRLPIDEIDSPALGEQPIIQSSKYTCPNCGNEYKSKKWLHRHRKGCDEKAKGILQDHIDQKDAKEPAPEVEKFICPICKLSFDRSIERAGHMAIHSRQPKEVMPILDNAEKQIKQIILTADDGKRELYKEVRRHILEAIEILL